MREGYILGVSRIVLENGGIDPLFWQGGVDSGRVTSRCSAGGGKGRF